MAEAPPNSIYPKTRAAWRAWLEKNHARREGVWMIMYKKASGKPYVAYDDGVEEALCFGWIDSIKNKLDEERSVQYYSPRKRGSGWSRVNKERIERMIAEGKMTPAGLEKIEAAKKDGTWTKLDRIEELEVPPDLRKALKANGAAWTHWEAFPRSVKRAILEWIMNAKRPETRAKRIEETARLAGENKRANQWVDKKKSDG